MLQLAAQIDRRVNLYGGHNSTVLPAAHRVRLADLIDCRSDRWKCMWADLLCDGK